MYFINPNPCVITSSPGEKCGLAVIGRYQHRSNEGLDKPMIQIKKKYFSTPPLLRLVNRGAIILVDNIRIFLYYHLP
jgi:hypothetical protein